MTSTPLNVTSPECILIVNDDADGLYLLNLDVKRAFPGSRILTADSGQKALDLWNAERVQAVVTDNRMPGMSGMTLSRKIRELNANVPIVMVTCSEEVREEALRAGVTLFSADNRIEGVIAALKSHLLSVKAA